MPVPSSVGRFRIGDHIVQLRSSRLSDAGSWRRTLLDHEERVRPAYARPQTDWRAQHSTAAWADIWWRSRTDPEVLLSRVLTVEDDGVDRVVGQQSFVGRDPRTGHSEASMWMAGLADAHSVALWVTTVNTLDALRAYPDLPFVVAPAAVANRPARALAEAAAYSPLHTARVLREFNGEPLDHIVYAAHNTAETRRRLAEIVASVQAEPLPAARSAGWARGDAVLGLARYGVRRARARMRGRGEAVNALTESVRTVAGHDVAFILRPDGTYAATVDGHGVGGIDIHVDLGTSTTEIIDRIRPDVESGAGAAAVTAACLAAADRQETRRLTVALADRHATAADTLAARGFASEGPASPTLGDEATPREIRTRLQGV